MATLADVRKLAALVALLDRPDEPDDHLLWTPSFENDNYSAYLQSLYSFDHEGLFTHVQMASRSLINQSRTNVAKRREKNLHAPIFVLPIEILSEISLLSMLPLSVSIWKSPVLAVCTRWRACVINTPKIWSHVYVAQGEIAAERQECWLQRAGVGVFMDFTVDDGEAFRKLEASWLSAPSLRRPKVRNLLFCCRSSQRIPPSPFPLQFDATYLHGLEAVSANSRVGDRPVSLFGHQVPQCLRRLRLISLIRPDSLRLSGWDASSLVSLELLDDIPKNDVLNLLANASQLERLLWSCCDEETSMNPHLPTSEVHTLKLAKLNFLFLNDSSSDGRMGKVLPMLEAPALKKNCFMRTRYTDHYQTFAKFAAKWPTLTHVWLHDDNEDHGNNPITDKAGDAILALQVASVLHALPNLEFFNATWCNANIQGLLALCGEFPTNAIRDRSEWACQSPRRLCLPLCQSLKGSILSQGVLSECLHRLLDARGYSGLIIVLDVPIETLQLLLDNKWVECGAVETEPSLIFGDE